MTTPDNALIDAARGREPVDCGEALYAALRKDVAQTLWMQQRFGLDGFKHEVKPPVLITLLDRIASLEAELEHANQWRDLALQFDGHRMQALGYLKALLRGEKDLETGARNFIASPPLSGEAVLTERLAQLSQAQAVPTTALSNLRHLYKQMIDGFVSDASKAKRIAEGLLSPAIQKLERLAASPTPSARKGLSDERIADLWGESKRGFDIECEHYFKAFRDAEAAHGIQGEGNAR